MSAMRGVITILVVSLFCWCSEGAAVVVGGLVKHVVQESQVTLHCHIPVGGRSGRHSIVMATNTPVIWLRFDMQDPNNHELISHGDQLLIDDTRMSVHYNATTNHSILTINRVQGQDSGSYQCQVPMETDVISSTPIELVIDAEPLRGPRTPNTARPMIGGIWMLAIPLLILL